MAWTLNQQVVVSIIYILAIITGTFRTVYRWYISRFWWEDVWATFALLVDIICFATVWMVPRVSTPDVLLEAAEASYWMDAVLLACGLWAARMSMITAIIRITSHHVQLRHSAYATAVAFVMMWTAILIQRLYICVARSCIMSQHIATSQLVTDVISDVLLMALPFFSLRGVNIEHSQRVLLVSSFASSICISLISIVHSIFLFLPSCTTTSIILAHVKTALALIICNLLVIVTLVYRLCRRNDLELHNMPTKSDGVQLTSIFIDNGELNESLGSTSSRRAPGRSSPSTDSIGETASQSIPPVPETKM